MKFLSSIAIAFLAAVSMTTACGEDYACPTGTEYRDGRCRLMTPDAEQEVFSWPPPDVGAELGQPSPFTGGALDTATPPDLEVPDGGESTTDADNPPPGRDDTERDGSDTSNPPPDDTDGLPPADG